jgi:hypothetical protein
VFLRSITRASSLWLKVRKQYPRLRCSLSRASCFMVSASDFVN